MKHYVIIMSLIAANGFAHAFEGEDYRFIQVQKCKNDSHYYTAITETAVKKVGAVKTGGVAWTCYGNGCFTVLRGCGSKNPSIGMCLTLSKQVGPIVQYGHTQKRLTPEQLKTCNSRWKR